MKHWIFNSNIHLLLGRKKIQKKKRENGPKNPTEILMERLSPPKKRFENTLNFEPLWDHQIYQKSQYFSLILFYFSICAVGQHQNKHLAQNNLIGTAKNWGFLKLFWAGKANIYPLMKYLNLFQVQLLVFEFRVLSLFPDVKIGLLKRAEKIKIN